MPRGDHLRVACNGEPFSFADLHGHSASDGHGDFEEREIQRAGGSRMRVQRRERIIAINLEPFVDERFDEIPLAPWA